MITYDASLQEAVEKGSRDAATAIKDAGNYDLNSEMFNDNTEEMNEENSNSDEDVNGRANEEVISEEALYIHSKKETLSGDLRENQTLSKLNKRFVVSETGGTIESGRAEQATNAEEVELFEGDIEITPEEILHVYDPDDVTNIMNVTVKRDAVKLRVARSSSSKLWPGGVVPYDYDPGLPPSRRAMIQSAMEAWENVACLQFVPRTTHSSYIRFRGYINRCSSSVGRQGGMQYVTIGSGCSQGSTMHEIGHAIGFWHEQSRPDRDSYIKIMSSNIKAGYIHNFLRRSYHDVDYQGTVYDYGSIMHYGLTFFSNCRNRDKCPTITITNPEAYNAQGQPTVGQRTQISSTDILQVRRLYRCPGPGVRGILGVYVRYAHNLPGMNRTVNKPAPYVQISAVTSTGALRVRRTSTKNGSTSLIFNEYIDFGSNSWQFIRVRVWDSDNSAFDALTQSQTIPITSSTHRFIKHCATPKCTGYLYLDYIFIPAHKECLPNTCLNGGVCTKGTVKYTCHCKRRYGGQRCEFLNRRLQVYAKYGHNLPAGFSNDSDLYIQFIAKNSDGKDTIKKIHTVEKNSSPTWNQRIDFGIDTWRILRVQIFDSNTEKDNTLSIPQTFSVHPGFHASMKHCASNSCNGYIYFNYRF